MYLVRVPRMGTRDSLVPVVHYMGMQAKRGIGAGEAGQVIPPPPPGPVVGCCKVQRGASDGAKCHASMWHLGVKPSLDA